MPKVLSLKLKNDIFLEAEDILRKIGKSRNAYINEALDSYNKENKRKLIREQLQYESKIVRENSLKTLEEFEKLEDPVLE